MNSTLDLFHRRRQIASELDVEAVLEGSVRSAGACVRISAQMIDGLTGFHLWSRTFNRRFEEPLRLQRSLAVAIVRPAELHSPVLAALQINGSRNRVSSISD